MISRLTIEDRVHAAADEFIAQGITPSVRLISKAIGGGNTEKIATAVRQWKTKQDSVNNFFTPDDCPDEIKRVFATSVSRLINEATSALREQIQYYKHQETENIEHFGELEREIEITKDLLAQERQSRAEERKHSEQELAMLRERNSTLEARVKEIEKDLENLRKQEQLAITERAKAELERDTIKEAAMNAQQLHDQLQKNYTVIRDEKEALKVHHEHLQTQLSGLENRFQEERNRTQEEKKRADEFLSQLQSINKRLQEDIQITSQEYQSKIDKKQQELDQLRDRCHLFELELATKASQSSTQY